MEKYIMFGIIHLSNETLKCLTPEHIAGSIVNCISLS